MGPGKVTVGAGPLPPLPSNTSWWNQGTPQRRSSHASRIDDVAIFNSIPKTELLTLSVDELRGDIRAILSAQGTGEVRVTFRPDALGRGLSVMVIMPRDRYSEEVRSEVGARYLGASDLGDTSALENPAAVEEIAAAR